jgi:hypothetical protein
MFATCKLGGINIAFPDVCLTPPVPPTGAPIPYPNFSLNLLGMPFHPKVFWMGGPAHQMLKTKVPTSMGDNAGLLTGIISRKVAGETNFITGAFTIFVGSRPATRMTTLCLMNGFNMLGMTCAPSQVKVLLLCA